MRCFELNVQREKLTCLNRFLQFNINKIVLCAIRNTKGEVEYNARTVRPIKFTDLIEQIVFSFLRKLMFDKVQDRYTFILFLGVTFTNLIKSGGHLTCIVLVNT
jgi:hypothetical protein